MEQIKDVVDRLRINEQRIKLFEQEKKQLRIKRQMDDERSNYCKCINIDLRNDLRILDLPNIFVFQGYIDRFQKLKVARHIILGEAIQVYKDTPDTIIYPVTELVSKRKFRHFYNRTSFNYLEQLAIDESFDIKTKKLGRIIIKPE